MEKVQGKNRNVIKEAYLISQHIAGKYEKVLIIEALISKVKINSYVKPYTMTISFQVPMKLIKIGQFNSKP